MSLTASPKHIYEPDPLQCGQAVLAMLAGVTVDEIIAFLDNERETDLKDMFKTLTHYGIGYSENRIEVKKREELPEICILSLETPKCWHWSLYYKGNFFDPEYGVLPDFPISNRKYYWEIKEKN